MEGLICYDDKKHFTIPKFYTLHNECLYEAEFILG